MPDEAKQDRDRFGEQARHLYREARQAGNGTASQAYALSSIAASLLRVGNLLEKFASPRVAIPQEADPPEEEEWYVTRSTRGHYFLTKKSLLMGPFTRLEAFKRLNELGELQ